MLENFNIENLHHAYLIEGEKEYVFPKIFKLLEKMEISIYNNPDFFNLAIDNFKVDDARRLKDISQEKSFSGKKRIFLVSFNSINADAQNSLLKLFEDPIPNIHFFIITPGVSALIPTFRSRFYFVDLNFSEIGVNKEIEKFIHMSPLARLDYLKTFLKKEAGDNEDEDEQQETLSDESVLSVRTRANQFLNQLEQYLFAEKTSKNNLDNKAVEIFKKIFFIRKMLREQGGSPKTLLEALALEI